MWSRPPASLCEALRAGLNVFYYTYVLKSLKDSRLYVGWTVNLRNRIKNHNLGKVFAAKGRRLLKLVYFEACLIKEGAIKREKQLKTGFGRHYLKNRI